MSPWIPFAWLITHLLGVVVHCCMHGRPRDEKYNGIARAIATLIVGAVLYWGGFFEALRGWAP